MIIDFVLKEKQHPGKISHIVSNCFEQSLCIEWAKKMIQLRDESKVSFVVSDTYSNFEEGWQTLYGEKILQEFSTLCKDLVSLQRTIRLSAKTAQSSVTGHSAHSSKVETV